MITILRTILGRIGGWLALAVGALAWLWVRDRQAKAEAKQEQEIEGVQARRKADDEVARIPDAVRVDELQRWER